MTLADFFATWRGLALENRLHRLAVLGLIGTNLITAVALLSSVNFFDRSATIILAG